MSNGFQCDWCPEGYYDCGPAPRCTGAPPAVEEMGVAAPRWHFVGDVYLNGGTTYHVKCKPGCDAKVEENDDASPPWRVVGQVTPTESGDWELFCQTGGPDSCHAALKPK
jgi:hypothetical protein